VESLPRRFVAGCGQMPRESLKLACTIADATGLGS